MIGAGQSADPAPATIAVMCASFCPSPTRRSSAQADRATSASRPMSFSTAEQNAEASSSSACSASTRAPHQRLWCRSSATT